MIGKNKLEFIRRKNGEAENGGKRESGTQLEMTEGWRERVGKTMRWNGLEKAGDSMTGVVVQSI